MSKQRWDASWKLDDWKVLATEKQKIYCKLFKNRNWEHYEEADFPYLKANIGYSFFGPPIVETKPNLKDFYNHYTNSQKERIDVIFRAIKKIIKKSNYAMIGFIFFIAIIQKNYTEFPIVKVLKNKKSDMVEEFEIIDSYGYTYKNWDKFITANMLPNGFYCYPKTGFYTYNESGEVDVCFRWFVCPVSYSILYAISGPNGGKGPLPVYPVMCISEAKGITEQTKELSFPIKPATGSADVYAIHTTYSIAVNSQRTKDVPQIISEALEFGFIKFNWYSILKNTENSIQNEKLETNRNIIEVLASVLFFCNTVLTSEITQQIIEEIRNDKYKRKFTFLNSMKKISLKKSLSTTGASTGSTLTNNLKFIDNRNAIFNEIIEKHFKAQSMILDEFGNYYMLGKLLELLVRSNETKRYTEIIRYYCLIVEETFRKCKDCSEIFENHKNFMENLKVKSVVIEQKDDTLESCTSVNDSSTQETKDEESLTTSAFEEAIGFSTPIEANTSHSKSNTFSEKDVTDESDELLLHKVLNAKRKETLGSVKQDKNSVNLNSDENFNREFLTPLKNHNKIKCHNDTKMITKQSKNDCNNTINTSETKKHNKNITEDEMLMDNNYVSLESRIVEQANKNDEETKGFFTPIKTNFSINSTSKSNLEKEITDGWLLQNVFNTKHQLTPRNVKQDHELVKSKSCGNLNNKEILTQLRNCINDIKIQNDTPVKVFPQHLKPDYNNINTPKTKKHNKKSITEHVMFIQNNKVPREKTNDSSFQENYITQGAEKCENKEDSKDQSQNESLENNSFINDSGLNFSTNFNNDESNNLSGKVTIFVRQMTEKFGPIDYFHAFIHDKLKDCKPIILNDYNDTDNWQFVIEEETCGVKLVKIDIRVRDENKEWVGVSYY